MNECFQLHVYGDMGSGPGACHICSKLKEARAMQSAAGWYIGVMDIDGPFCRITRYFETENDALKYWEYVTAEAV